MKLMLSGVTAIALAATGALAQPGGVNGNGNGGGGNGGDNARESPAVDHSRQGEGQARGQGQAQTTARDNGAPAERGNSAVAPTQASNGNGNARSAQGADANTRGAVAAGQDRSSRDWREPPLRYLGDDRQGSRRDESRYFGIVNGCPTGLAAANNGCQPPGQARKTSWLPRDRYDLGWWGLPSYDDGFYRYDNGYLLRLGDDGRVSGFIPLLGGALSVGNRWPDAYGYDSLSPYYSDYYGLGPVGSYRYADNVVYRLDPETAAITSIAALLTGDDFAVGDPLPSGYDVYNVPYDYRDRYQDSQEASYRYSDGFVYEVDPTTQLIVAAIELLV